MSGLGFLGGTDSKESTCNAGGSQVRFQGQEDPLEGGMATHSSILAWRIPRTEEPGGLQFMGCKQCNTTERLISFPFFFDLNIKLSRLIHAAACVSASSLFTGNRYYSVLWTDYVSLIHISADGNFVFFHFLEAGGSKITEDGDCSHEIKRCLLLGRKVMSNLHGIFKSRDITLPTNVHLVKAMVFPVVLHGCESWTVKKAEH